MTDRPIGRRFSHLYVARGEPTADSVKARCRIKTYIHNQLDYSPRCSLAEFLTAEIGRPFTSSLEMLDKVNAAEFLDAVTLIYHWGLDSYNFDSDDWRKTVARIFEEENLNYEIDRKGGVHYKVDAEFNRNITSTLKGLSASRFKAATASVEAIQPALDGGDYRQAVRHVFDAAENVFKTILGSKVSRLGTAEIKNHLTPRLQPAYEGASQHASRLMLQSFDGWVSAAHFYRHVEGQADPPPPPLEVAVLLISTGLSFVRWLLAVEEKLEAQG